MSLRAVRGPDAAELATSPLALLCAGVGVAAGLAVDLGPAGAVAGGALLWAARVAVGMVRRRSVAPAGPVALAAPWDELVVAIEASAARVAQARRAARPGPLADRLAATVELVEGVVGAARQVAMRADGLARAAAGTDVATLRARLQQLEGEAGDAPLHEDRSGGDRGGDLRAQLDAVERAQAATAAAEAGLRQLDGGLAAAALRAEELSARAGGGLELTGPRAELADLADHLASLQAALDGLGDDPGLPPPRRPTDP